MVNLLLNCGRRLKAKELLRRENTARFVHQHSTNEEILIPKRKERGPLDILKALSATVQYEQGVPEYRFQCGTLFDTTRHFRRRNIAMAMDSGRKAAKWVVAENPKLFQHNYAEPYIKEFAPPIMIDENSELTEAHLIEAIHDVKVEDAIKIYKTMKEKNIDISIDVKQLLLEMVCYYNCENKPDDTLIETKYYETPTRVTLNAWMKGCFAEELFSEMEPNTEAYTALILGMFKHNNVSSAMKLYEEAKEKGIYFDVDIYNALIEHVEHKAFEFHDKEAHIINLLKEMKEKKIEPNQGTLNSTLKAVAGMRRWAKARNLAAKVYQEFKSIEIEPSLATYYYVLLIFTDKVETSSVFIEIINEMENKSFVASHQDDFKFFPEAMGIAIYNFRNVSLAERVHNLLTTGYNRNFLVGNVDSINYFRTYITGMFRFGDLDKAVDLFMKFVPLAYIPESLGIVIIISALESNKGWQQLLRIWPVISEVAISTHKVYPKLLKLLIRGILDEKNEKLTEIAKEAWKYGADKNPIVSDSNIVSLFLKLFVLAMEKSLSDEVFDKARTKASVKLDFVPLDLYNNFCMTTNDKRRTLMCIEYSVAAGHRNVDLSVNNLKSKFELKEGELAFVEGLLKKWKVSSDTDEMRSTDAETDEEI